MRWVMRHTRCGALGALVFAFAVVQAEPVAAADKETRQLMADIRILQEQSQQLQNLIGTLAEALKIVDARLNTRLDEQANANRKAFADEKLIVDTLSSDLRVVREKVDDNNVRISSLTQELEALRTSVTQLSAPRLSSVTPETEDPSAAGSAAGPVPPGTTPTTPTPPPVSLGASPTRIFDMAYANYTSGQYDLAIEGFEAYLRSFPKTTQAGDAQVYVGDSFLNDGKYDKAVEAYDNAIRNYAGGNRIPDAYYKKGLALINLKQLDRAREAFEFVIKTYPDSAAGSLAKQQLAKLVKP